ncbi:MAG: heme lyase CcmF/NrfE family subunit [Candidatus Methylomirabilales bacterium]
MTATFGWASLLGAFLLALYGVAAPIAGVRLGRPALLRSVRWAILGQFVLVTAASLALIYALVTTDFSIKYVAFNTTRNTPIYYRVTGLWGALEGSLLLWEWILIICSAAVAWIYRARQREFLPYVLAILSAVSAFFLLVMVVASPPFERIFPVPPDGRGLNPLLEDANMFTHPPLLYTGFVGLTVPYAFAMASLITGRLDEAWVFAIRRWTIFAWFFLSMGNLVGAWWSYHVLGWGGYWAWDPVENAAFLPWLPATAFLHSIQIQERRRMLKAWNLSLIILAFALTIFGTFLTRSGILSSIHAFSSGPVGAFFLAFLLLVLAGSFGLLIWRADRLRGQPELDSLVSRESAFLLQNVVLLAATFTILFGTIFPLLAEAVRGVKVSVGGPYFNLVTIPLFLALVLLMGVGPLIAWRKASWDSLKRNFLLPAGAALAVGVAAVAWGVREFFLALAFTLAAFVVATILWDMARAARARARMAGGGLLQAVGSLFVVNPRRYGGFVVHFGIVLIVLGIAVSMGYSVERELTLARGESLEIGRYRIRFEGLAASQQPTHVRVEGLFQVFNDRHDLGVLRPTLKYFPSQESPIGRAVFRSTLREDLYLILSGFFTPTTGESATLKVLVRPMIAWIWIGGGVLAVGTLLCVWPFRRRPTRARA